MSERKLLTQERIAEIEQRERAATPGPWFEIKTTKAGKAFEYSKYPFEIPDDLVGTDQHFINRARSDVPDLLAERRALLEMVRDLRRALMEEIHG